MLKIRQRQKIKQKLTLRHFARFRNKPRQFLGKLRTGFQNFSPYEIEMRNLNFEDGEVPCCLLVDTRQHQLIAAAADES